MDVKTKKERVKRDCKAFTLMELLVVISIIALLLAILVPSLRKARGTAQAVKCAAQMRSFGLASLAYVTENGGMFPFSYVYPYNAKGNYDIYNQDVAHPYGYVHWSSFLFYSGRCNAEAFMCPSMNMGGAPRTNPGTNKTDWEAAQVDQNGQSQPNNLTDRQAPRMSFTANAAIIPRNKFTTIISGGQRVNRLVRITELKSPNAIILATEFNKNWKAIGVQQGAGILSKSHRPILPFSHIGTGYIGNAVYQAPLSTPGYVYGDSSDTSGMFGIKPQADIDTASDLLDGGAGHPINAVGRHHPGPGQTIKYGGCANFLYCDGHVKRKTVLETMKNREWGEVFYSITGRNEVLP